MGGVGDPAEPGPLVTDVVDDPVGVGADPGDYVHVVATQVVVVGHAVGRHPGQVPEPVDLDHVWSAAVPTAGSLVG